MHPRLSTKGRTSIYKEVITWHLFGGDSSMIFFYTKSTYILQEEKSPTLVVIGEV